MSIKQNFTQKIAKEIAMKSFAHVLDGILGYDDDRYTFEGTRDGEEFIQNFEEDLQETGLAVTESRLRAIQKQYVRIHEGFEAFIRAKYYKK